MTIIRSAHDSEHPFVAVVRSTAQNKALSYEALGMLTYLLSQADNWVVVVDDLVREGCGRDKVYRIMKELKEAGYVQHSRSVAGQHQPPMWAERTIHEQPLPDMPDSVKPSPIPEKPDLVKPYAISPETAIQETVKSLPIPTQARAAESLSLSTKDSKTKDKDKAAAANAQAREEKLPERPNAFTVWEQEMTPLSPMIVDAIRDWIANYPAGWAEDAIREAKMSGGAAPNYVQKILNRWRREGKNSPRAATVSGAGLKPTPPPSPSAPQTVTPKGGVGLSWNAYLEVTGQDAKTG